MISFFRPYDLHIAVIILLATTLSGCQFNDNYAPVIDRKGRISDVPKTHSVVRGETLYSIAWTYGIDFRQLASTNGIASPYTIYPHQKLALQSGGGGSHSVSPSSPSTTQKPPRKSVSELNSKEKSPAKKSARVSKNKQQTVDEKAYPFRWQWPIKSKLVKSFDARSATHKGIDIKGNLGESVHAANSGKVVYSGSGLVGYGNLLIIKHNERYLSAYGNNRKLLVKEGELVKVGQRIAEIGKTGTDKVKLHFEIRRDGKPVDPLKLLPKR